MLFDWLVVGQVIAMTPASSVRGPKHSVKNGKTPVRGVDEARAMLDAQGFLFRSAITRTGKLSDRPIGCARRTSTA